MNRDEVIQKVQNGGRVIVQLTEADVASIKKDYFRTSRSGWAGGAYRKFVVQDPTYGTVWFASSGEWFWNLDVEDRISLKLEISGVGTPSERYPDPILFAKPLRKSRDNPLQVIKGGFQVNNFEGTVDLGINV